MSSCHPRDRRGQTLRASRTCETHSYRAHSCNCSFHSPDCASDYRRRPGQLQGSGLSTAQVVEAGARQLRYAAHTLSGGLVMFPSCGYDSRSGPNFSSCKPTIFGNTTLRLTSVELSRCEQHRIWTKSITWDIDENKVYPYLPEMCLPSPSDVSAVTMVAGPLDFMSCSGTGILAHG